MKRQNDHTEPTKVEREKTTTKLVYAIKLKYTCPTCTSVCTPEVSY